MRALSACLDLIYCQVDPVTTEAASFSAYDYSQVVYAIAAAVSLNWVRDVVLWTFLSLVAMEANLNMPGLT